MLSFLFAQRRGRICICFFHASLGTRAYPRLLLFLDQSTIHHTVSVESVQQIFLVTLFHYDGSVGDIRTDRLLLRGWRDSDREPFARINRDPAVMEFFPSPLSAQESSALFDRIQSHFVQYGFGLWAAEVRERGDFIGYVGLAVPRFLAAFTPCVEIGWRLGSAHWGKGLATEGARAVAGHAFNVLRLDELVSFTVPANVRSRRVMEKLGMTHDPAEDFDHPMMPLGHPQCRHVLYRLKREDGPVS